MGGRECDLGTPSPCLRRAGSVGVAPLRQAHRAAQSCLSTAKVNRSNKSRAPVYWPVRKDSPRPAPVANTWIVANPLPVPISHAATLLQSSTVLVEGINEAYLYWFH